MNKYGKVEDKVSKDKNNEKYNVYAVITKENESENEIQITYSSVTKQDLDKKIKHIKEYIETQNWELIKISSIKEDLRNIAIQIIDKALSDTMNGNYCFDLKDLSLEYEDVLQIKEYMKSDERISDIELDGASLDINCYLDYCTNLDLGQDELEQEEEEKELCED